MKTYVMLFGVVIIISALCSCSDSSKDYEPEFNYPFLGMDERVYLQNEFFEYQALLGEISDSTLEKLLVSKYVLVKNISCYLDSSMCPTIDIEDGIDDSQEVKYLTSNARLIYSSEKYLIDFIIISQQVSFDTIMESLKAQKFGSLEKMYEIGKYSEIPFSRTYIDVNQLSETEKDKIRTMGIGDIDYIKISDYYIIINLLEIRIKNSENESGYGIYSCSQDSPFNYLQTTAEYSVQSRAYQNYWAGLQKFHKYFNFLFEYMDFRILNTNPVSSPVVAIVGSEKITQAELLKKINDLPYQVNHEVCKKETRIRAIGDLLMEELKEGDNATIESSRFEQMRICETSIKHMLKESPSVFDEHIVSELSPALSKWSASFEGIHNPIRILENSVVSGMKADGISEYTGDQDVQKIYLDYFGLLNMDIKYRFFEENKNVVLASTKESNLTFDDLINASRNLSPYTFKELEDYSNKIKILRYLFRERGDNNPIEYINTSFLSKCSIEEVVKNVFNSAKFDKGDTLVASEDKVVTFEEAVKKLCDLPNDEKLFIQSNDVKLQKILEELKPESHKKSKCLIDLDGPMNKLAAVRSFYAESIYINYPFFNESYYDSLITKGVKYMTKKKFYEVVRPNVRDSTLASYGLEFDEPFELLNDELFYSKSPLFYCSVNFQPDSVDVPQGFLKDNGEKYGLKPNGYYYGWDQPTESFTRYRSESNVGLEHQTINFFHKEGRRRWEIQVPNGNYLVVVTTGDANFSDHINNLIVEDQVLWDIDGMDNFDVFVKKVSVQDGRLTLYPHISAVKSRICSVKILADNTNHH